MRSSVAALTVGMHFRLLPTATKKRATWYRVTSIAQNGNIVARSITDQRWQEFSLRSPILRLIKEDKHLAHRA